MGGAKAGHPCEGNVPFLPSVLKARPGSARRNRLHPIPPGRRRGRDAALPIRRGGVGFSPFSGSGTALRDLPCFRGELDGTAAGVRFRRQEKPFKKGIKQRLFVPVGTQHEAQRRSKFLPIPDIDRLKGAKHVDLLAGTDGKTVGTESPAKSEQVFDQIGFHRGRRNNGWISSVVRVGDATLLPPRGFPSILDTSFPEQIASFQFPLKGLPIFLILHDAPEGFPEGTLVQLPPVQDRKSVV